MMPVLIITLLSVELASTARLFPYTTLFRSVWSGGDRHHFEEKAEPRRHELSAPILDRQQASGVVKQGRSSLPIEDGQDRKSTRLNSSHLGISYAVFCWKK